MNYPMSFPREEVRALSWTQVEALASEFAAALTAAVQDMDRSVNMLESGEGHRDYERLFEYFRSQLIAAIMGHVVVLPEDQSLRR